MTPVRPRASVRNRPNHSVSAHGDSPGLLERTTAQIRRVDEGRVDDEGATVVVAADDDAHAVRAPELVTTLDRPPGTVDVLVGEGRLLAEGTLDMVREDPRVVDVYLGR